ncbi:MAG: hypothetical protein WD876_03575 [Candidatus Pacearchaeota archaeon]
MVKINGKIVRLIIPVVLSVIILTIFFISTISSIDSNPGNYVSIPHFTHSHTKAICNSTNYCQDHEIFCQSDKVISISPITGVAIQFSKTWKNPRYEAIKNQMC